MGAFQLDAFQANAFQTGDAPPPPPPPPAVSAGGGRWTRHFAAGEARYTYGPSQPVSGADAGSDAQSGSESGSDAQSAAAEYARETVDSMLRAVDAAQQALDARLRTDEIKRLIDLQIVRDEDEAIILILALA